MQDRKIIEDYKSFNRLMKTCLEIDPKHNRETFQNYEKTIIDLSNQASDKILHLKTEFSKIPLIGFVYSWLSNFNLSSPLDSLHIDMMQFFIDKKIISYKINNKLVTLAEFVELNHSPHGHSNQIDFIRCYKEWTLEKRESYVSFYLEFIKWLSKTTYGYVSEALDVDRTLTSGRLLRFETYLKIINNLLIRERILAKIFYIGGSRTLEEVFSLKIEDINFKKQTLHLSGKPVDYPKHLFEDLKEYIYPRKKGFIFISREGDQIDPTVPYRALKLVTNKLELDKSFTFMDFMKSA